MKTAVACLLCVTLALIPPRPTTTHSVYIPLIAGVSGGTGAIDWAEAEKMIMNCYPDYIIVFHWQRVHIINVPARYETTEPYINAAIDLAQKSGCNTPVMIQ